MTDYAARREVALNSLHQFVRTKVESGIYENEYVEPITQVERESIFNLW